MLKEMQQVMDKLQTVEDLLSMGHFVRFSSDTIKANKVFLKTIFDTDSCLIGIATFPMEGDTVTEHIHPGVTQYLLAYKGRLGVTFGNGGYRILDIGDCAKVSVGELHKIVSLNNNAELLFVCIPAEKGYKIDKNICVLEQLSHTS